MNIRFRFTARTLDIFLTILFLLTGCASTESTPSPVQPTSAPVEATSTVALPTLQQSTAPATQETSSTLMAGQWTHLFYHDVLEQVILVNGGPESGKPATDPLELWGWDGNQWSLISADEDGPTWRNWAAAAYDSTRDVLIIYGGLQNPTNKFDETWEWNGEQWTEFIVPGPSLREGSLMAYDATRAQTILFGGAVDLDIQGDTWAWNGSQWTLVSQVGPAPRFPGGMVFDPLREEVLITSGHFAATTGAFIDYGDLWAWDGTAWRELTWSGSSPGHRTHTALVYDPQTENILLFGSGIGTFKSDVWSWDRTSWTMIPTSNMPDRSGHSVAYDKARDVFVFFGGVDRPGGKALRDTWEWDRIAWSCVENCQ